MRLTAEISEGEAAHFGQPEDELLIGCVRAHFDAAAGARLQQVAGDPAFDWDRLLRLAKRHRLQALVFAVLSASDAQIPADVLAALRLNFNLNVSRNLYLTGALVRLIAHFNAHAIRVIPFKGPALAQVLYGSLSLREFGDLDILIQPSDRERVKQALADLDFVPQDDLDAEAEAAHYRDKYNRVYRSTDGLLVLEVHWSLTYVHFASIHDPQLFWAHAHAQTIFNQSILTPRPEDLLIYLLGHGYRHMWERLSWLVDVAALLHQHPALDWAYVLETAARLRVTRLTLLGLWLAHDLLAAPIPDMVQARIARVPSFERFTRQIYAALFVPDEPDVPNIEKFVFHLKLREHVGDKIAYLRMIAAEKLPPNERDRALVALPPYLAFVYVLLRPLRLLRERGAAWWAALRRQLT